VKHAAAQRSTGAAPGAWRSDVALFPAQIPHQVIKSLHAADGHATVTLLQE
jgi:hypothetical protein